MFAHLENNAQTKNLFQKHFSFDGTYECFKWL